MTPEERREKQRLQVIAILQREGIDAETASKFWEWHQAHPDVWQEFEQAALDLLDSGVEHYGAKAIAEVVRYHKAIARGKDDFIVNNNYTAYYARIFRLKYPKHKDFFEIRNVKGLRGDA